MVRRGGYFAVKGICPFKGVPKIWGSSHVVEKHRLRLRRDRQCGLAAMLSTIEILDSL